MFNRILAAVVGRWYPLAVLLLIAWHLVQSAYYALNVDTEVFPDERQHAEIVGAFLKYDDAFFVKEHPETMDAGAVSRYSFLYTTTVAYLSKLNVFGVSPLLFLRGLSVFFSVIGLVISWRLVRELTDSRVAAVVALVIQTNLLMAVFLSAAVNYDNLANPLAYGALWAFLRHMRTRSAISMLVCLSALLIGGLVKFTILAWVPLLVLGLVVVNCRDMQGLWSSFKTQCMRPLGAAIFALFLVSSALAANLYLVNLVRYGRIVVLCEPVLPPEVCHKFDAQTKRVDELRELNKDKPILPLATYVPRFLDESFRGIIGIVAHRPLPMPGAVKMTEVRMLLALSGLGLLLALPTHPRRRVLIFGAVGMLYYIGCVMQHHHGLYLETKEFSRAVQGRYWFPALPLIGGLIAVGYAHLWNTRLRGFMAFVLFVVLVDLSFGQFWREASAAGLLNPARVLVAALL